MYLIILCVLSITDWPLQFSVMVIVCQIWKYKFAYLDKYQNDYMGNYDANKQILQLLHP